MKNDEYMRILAVYFRSILQNIESFLRTEIDLVEDGIRLVLYECNSSFILYDSEPDSYTFKDLSEAFLTYFNLKMNF